MISAWWLALIPIASLLGWCMRVRLDRGNDEVYLHTIDALLRTGQESGLKVTWDKLVDQP